MGGKVTEERAMAAMKQSTLVLSIHWGQPKPKGTYDMVTGLKIEISNAPSPKTTLLTETLAGVKWGKRRGEALM
ncbi:hypothetical protein Bca4012_061670 [Brassica carinata]